VQGPVLFGFAEIKSGFYALNFSAEFSNQLRFGDFVRFRGYINHPARPVDQPAAESLVADCVGVLANIHRVRNKKKKFFDILRTFFVALKAGALKVRRGRGNHHRVKLTTTGGRQFLDRAENHRMAGVDKILFRNKPFHLFVSLGLNQKRPQQGLFSLDVGWNALRRRRQAAYAYSMHVHACPPAKVCSLKRASPRFTFSSDARLLTRGSSTRRASSQSRIRATSSGKEGKNFILDPSIIDDTAASTSLGSKRSRQET